MLYDAFNSSALSSTDCEKGHIHYIWIYIYESEYIYMHHVYNYVWTNDNWVQKEDWNIKLTHSDKTNSIP